jgi:8-oxo-dGTP pyrophosphatase MutT (NUDIX family)
MRWSETAATVFDVKRSNPVPEQAGWETISSETHFTNSHLKVVTERVKTPTRRESRAWTIVHRKSAVIVAPITRDGNILLIRQERVPVRAAIWEMPAGQIEGSGEPSEKEIEATALRELREETGYELASDGELIPLGHYFSSPGFTDECGYCFLARPVQPCVGPRVREESEHILDCRSFSPAEFARMIGNNEIRDANTLSMAARLVARGFVSLDS